MTYNGLGAGSATVTFNAVSPTGSLGVDQLGTQTGSDTSGSLYVQRGPRIQISADAQVPPSGSFMFLQIMNKSCREYTTLNN